MRRLAMNMPVRLAPLAPGASLRGLRWPIAAAVAAWLVAVLGVATVNRVAERSATMCTFRNLTGCPCPFCGGTRAALALGRGDWRRALALNPLAVATLAGCAGWAALRFGLRRRVQWRRPRVGRAMMVVGWMLAIAALCANWVYVWIAGI